VEVLLPASSQSSSAVASDEYGVASDEYGLQLVVEAFDCDRDDDVARLFKSPSSRAVDDLPWKLDRRCRVIPSGVELGRPSLRGICGARNFGEVASVEYDAQLSGELGEVDAGEFGSYPRRSKFGADAEGKRKLFLRHSMLLGDCALLFGVRSILFATLLVIICAHCLTEANWYTLF
jgi:hypothetical protein